jgi:hypothetical protein
VEALPTQLALAEKGILHLIPIIDGNRCGAFGYINVARHFNLASLHYWPL